jgi:hypothetical protein
VIAIDKQLTSIAEWLQSMGGDGTISQLRAAAYTALLAGRELATLLPPAAPSPDSGSPGSDRAATDSGASDRAGKDAAGGDFAATGSTATDGTATDGTATDGRATDGRATDGRATDGRATDGRATDGTATDTAATDGTAERPDPGSPAAGSPAAGREASAGWPRLTGTVHLTMPLSAWAGVSQNPGEVAGYGPADAGTCRELAAMMGTSARWCLTLTGPGGRAVAHACARRPPPPGPGLITWAAGLRDKLATLETGHCSHARQSPRYVPPPNLVHLIRVRQRTCSFPGCRRAAVRCDTDHTVPFDQGGITCECNLAPLCRRHHQAKQAPGWHLTQDQPAVMTWRLPNGRTYQTTGDPHPV